MAGAAVLATAVVWNGRTSRREGGLLVAAYVAAVALFYFVGGR
jgi:Ca2+/H+ antiporter